MVNGGYDSGDGISKVVFRGMGLVLGGILDNLSKNLMDGMKT